MALGPHLERLLATAVTKFKSTEHMPDSELPYLYFDAADDAVAEMLTEEFFSLVVHDLQSAPPLHQRECDEIVPSGSPTAKEILLRTIEASIRSLMREIPELMEENRRRREVWLAVSA